MARPLKVTDAEILDEARRRFIEDGPGVSTACIADALGVSEAAVFKRFGTKQELLVRACCPADVPEWIGAVAAGPDPTRPIGPQITELAQHLLAHFRRITPMLAALKAGGVELERVLSQYDVPPPVLGHRAITAWVQRAVDQGQLAPCDVDAVAFVFMGSIWSRSMLQLIAGSQMPEFDADRFVAQLVRILLGGLAPATEVSG